MQFNSQIDPRLHAHKFAFGPGLAPPRQGARALIALTLDALRLTSSD